MFYIKRYSLLVVLVCLTQMSACSIYYNTKDINKSTRKVSVNIDKNTSNAKKDYFEFVLMKDQLLNNSSSSSQAVYKKIGASLKELKAAISSIEKSENPAKLSIKNLEALASGKNKIKSGTPDWDKLQSLKKKLSKDTDQYSERLKHYEKVRRNLVAFLNKEKINKVNVLEVRKEFKKFTEDAMSNIRLAKSELQKANRKLSRYKARKSDTKKVSKISRELEQVKSILEKIENKSSRLTQLMHDFVDAAKGQKEMWVAPGMASHSTMIDIESSGKELSALSKQFNKLIANLKRG